MGNIDLLAEMKKSKVTKRIPACCLTRLEMQKEKRPLWRSFEESTKICTTHFMIRKFSKN